MHKLITYTDESLIENQNNSLRVHVFAKVVVDEKMKNEFNLDTSKTNFEPVKIEVKFSRSTKYHTNESLLSSAEALAQIAAISPDFMNIFGVKKGIGTTRLMLISSQQTLVDSYVDHKSSKDSVLLANLAILSTFFYGTPMRAAKESDIDWTESLLQGDVKPSVIYNTSHRNIMERFVIKHNVGNFMITRRSIEDFLSLPHKYHIHKDITRPFNAVKGIFSSYLEDAEDGSPLAPKVEYDEAGNLYSNFISKNDPKFDKGGHSCLLKTVESFVYETPVYVVYNIDVFLPLSVIMELKEQGIEHGNVQEIVRSKYRKIQDDCTKGLLG